VPPNALAALGFAPEVAADARVVVLGQSVDPSFYPLLPPCNDAALIFVGATGALVPGSALSIGPLVPLERDGVVNTQLFPPGTRLRQFTYAGVAYGSGSLDSWVAVVDHWGHLPASGPVLVTFLVAAGTPVIASNLDSTIHIVGSNNATLTSDCDPLPSHPVQDAVFRNPDLGPSSVQRIIFIPLQGDWVSSTAALPNGTRITPWQHIGGCVNSSYDKYTGWVQ